MAKYKALIKSFIDGYIREEGEEFEYSGIPGSSLHPLDEEAKAAKESARSKTISLSLLKPGETDPELEELRRQYEEMFGEAPHFNTKAETLKAKIAERRKELGV